MNSSPTLAVKDKETGEKRVYRIAGGAASIGRDRNNPVPLPSKRISRQHAEIRHEGGDFFIVDLKSSNGTYLNNQRLSPNEKTLLRSSDKIRIEHFEITIEPEGSNGANFHDATDTDILEVKMIKKLLRAVDKESAPVLEVAGGPEVGRRFIFDGKIQEITIGRDAGCEFHIDDEVISRKHVRVSKKWDTVTIIDLDSKNGVFVNDQKVTEHPLKDGDRILLGTLPIIFRNPTSAGWDFLASEPPPAIERPEPEVSEPSQISSSQPVTSSEPEEHSEVSQTGKARVARKKGYKEKGNSEVSTSETAGSAEANEDPAEPKESWFAKLPFGPLEIIAALIGLTVLSGSIWLLLKLL